MEKQSTIPRILQFVKPYKGRLGIAMVCMVIVASMAGAQAYMVKPMLDEVFFKKDQVMLMVVPLIFGKVAKDFLGGEISFANENFGVMSVGFIAAFVSGLLACQWMISLVKNSKLYYFSVYCFIVGSFAIGYAYFYIR